MSLSDFPYRPRPRSYQVEKLNPNIYVRTREPFLRDNGYKYCLPLCRLIGIGGAA